MKIIRALVGAAWLSAAVLSPATAGTGTITTKDAAGTTRTFDVVTDGSGNFVAEHVICDQSAAAYCATVTSANALKVDGSGATQPVSGTFWQTTQPISAASGTIASGAIASGAVASGAYASGAFASGSGADGWNVTDGAKADGACGTSTGTCSIVALLKYLNQQMVLNVANTGAAIPAGTAAIGTLLPFAETAASSGVLKASAGNLYTLSADAVTATTDLKLLLFNSATLPADGTVAPYKCISFKGDGTQASMLLSWTADALAFTTGISAAVSSATACTTKTNVTATISGQVQ
jgi:hypothetical protein